MKALPEILKQKLRDPDRIPNPIKDGSSMAAVLLPLVIESGEWHLLFSRRTKFVSTHQNEVSFPGGSFEFADQDLRRTALRETREEIGIAPEEIEILGGLETIQTVTGFTVTPYVAVLTWPIDLVINECEVDSVFTIPISWLMSKENYFEEDYHSEKYGIRKVIHYKDYKGEHVWGFTAKLTQELIKLIK
jgi:8-oxo-dGTP pyrophosphatase MutT (NUDIX family)